MNRQPNPEAALQKMMAMVPDYDLMDLQIDLRQITHEIRVRVQADLQLLAHSDRGVRRCCDIYDDLTAEEELLDTEAYTSEKAAVTQQAMLAVWNQPGRREQLAPLLEKRADLLRSIRQLQKDRGRQS